MISNLNINTPPFAILYNGNSEFIIHKGVVVNATTGAITYPTINGEALTDGWSESGSVITVESGQDIICVITHANKTEFLFYETVDITSAIITIGNAEDFNSDTKTAVKIGSVEYEDTYSPTIEQTINSDIYIAILGQKAFV